MDFKSRPDLYDPWLLDHTKSALVYQQCRWCAVKTSGKKVEIRHFETKKLAKKFCQQNPDWEVSEYHGYTSR